jgi:hypothetical protein
MRRRMMLLLTVALVFSVSGGQKAGSASRTSAGSSETANEVLAFERQREAAVVRGDVAYLDKVISADFSFTHGDGWTDGGAPLKVDDRASWLEAVGKAPYLRRDLDSVKVEMQTAISPLRTAATSLTSRTRSQTARASPCGSRGCTPSATGSGSISRTAQ